MPMRQHLGRTDDFAVRFLFFIVAEKIGARFDNRAVLRFAAVGHCVVFGAVNQRCVRRGVDGYPKCSTNSDQTLFD